MRAILARFRIRFHVKILLPVLGIMALLTGITAWVVDHRITAQLRTDAAERLATADAVFQNSLKIRTKNLVLRYRNLPKEPRYQSQFVMSDANTLRHFLGELLEEAGVDAIAFIQEDGRVFASTAQDPDLDLAEFALRLKPSAEQALQGRANVDSIDVNGRLFEVVSIPVPVGDRLEGVLIFALESSTTVAQEVKQLTHADVAFLVDNRVVACTMMPPQISDLVDHQHAPGSKVVRPVEINGEHYLYAIGRVPTLNKNSSIRYLLLYSYEKALIALASTQQVLWWARLTGLGTAAVIIWLLIQRISQPLTALRDSTEAVGRGDFSRPVSVKSRDEFGELAEAFNRMLENLSTSRQQLQTTQAQLVQSEKLAGIGEFVAGVTHELNNPLTTVIGFAELLQRADLSPQHQRYLDHIVKGAHRSHKIVQSLLSFARQHKPERKLVKLHDLIEATIEILAYQLRTSNIQVTTRFDPNLPKVMADAHQIQQVFLNILNNARQAIEGFRPKGSIMITTEGVGDTICVVIQDDGPGISPENLKKIFNPFFTTKEVGKGTGLGLSLCYGIIQEHGGKIEVRSNPGEGAAFTIILPVAIEAEQPSSEPRAVGDKTAVFCNGAGKRILVVDDEEGILTLVREAFAANGFELDMARDGETALRLLREKDYDVIICDWRMPGLNGQQIYERLAAFKPELASRLIFVTGDVISKGVQAFMRQCGNTCLSKPFSLQEIRLAVANLLQAKSSSASDANRTAA